MGKKRKVSHQVSAPSGPREVIDADARLGPITTFADVADSEDEYFLKQDQIALDAVPQPKRQKRLDKEEAFLEASDEEILDFDDDESNESNDDDGDAGRRKHAPQASRKRLYDESEDEAPARGEEEGEDSGWWGSTKKDYYSADAIETEADALEEEKEARRLQQKKLAKMAEADFMFDESEWQAAAGEQEDREVITEVLDDVEITVDMPPVEQYKLLQARYPEFDYLVDEFQELQPLVDDLQKEAEGRPSKSVEVVRYWVLGCYVAALASYFAILTSPARDVDGTRKPLGPAELRDHEVMETLVQCREMWLKVKRVKISRGANSVAGMLPLANEEVTAIGGAVESTNPSKPTKQVKEKVSKREKNAGKKEAAEKKKRDQEIEASIADLSNLLKKSKKLTKPQPAPPSSAPIQAEDDRSDFGEEDILDARTASDKATRKKSLKFYTSQIVQKAHRRTDAGQAAGGDMDIPYRERLRDRQARLNAEAERRGKQSGNGGGDLGSDNDSGNEDGAVVNADRDDGDEYYDMVASASRKKKQDKTAKYAALAAAGKGDRIVEMEEIGPDGKRKITYNIQANKGLMQRRKKDQRNPRVKKRSQYVQKQKKLKSMKPVYGGGEGKGGYQGELTGIKAGLIKSVKL